MFLTVGAETVILNVYIINTGYIHPPVDMIFFHAGLVFFPFCSCLSCICVPQFSRNTQQPRTFFCSSLKNCATASPFPLFNYATITYVYWGFLWGGGEKISWCLEHFSSGSFESLAIEVCLIVMDYFYLPQLLPLWWQLQLLGASIYVALERTYNLDSNSVWLCCLIKEMLWWHAVSFQILCLPPGRTNSMS